MADGDGWTTQLLVGLAVKLHTAGVGRWIPPGTGTYLATDRAIVIQKIPTAPDRLITLSAYLVDAVPGMQDITVAVQARLRGTTDPDVCQDMGDALFEALDSSGRQTWGDIPIVDVVRQSYVPLGFDTSNRWEAAHNYYVEAMRKTLYRNN